MEINASAPVGNSSGNATPAVAGDARLVEYLMEYLMEQNARLREQVSDLVGLLRTALGKGGWQNVQGEGELSAANLQ